MLSKVTPGEIEKIKKQFNPKHTVHTYAGKQIPGNMRENEDTLEIFS